MAHWISRESGEGESEAAKQRPRGNASEGFPILPCSVSAAKGCAGLDKTGATQSRGGEFGQRLKGGRARMARGPQGWGSESLGSAADFCFAVA